MSGSTQATSASAAQRVPTYEVIAVKFGELVTSRSHVFLNYADYGQADAPFTIAYYFWVIRGHDRVILVDTGFEAGVAQARGRTVLVDPIVALSALGVTADFTGEIVLTHAHYDHIGNVRSFPHATLVMSRTEFEFWTGADSQHDLFQSLVETNEIATLSDLHRDGRLRLVDGDEDLFPGIRLVHTSGHTPGELMVTVTTGAGTVLLTSDAVHFDEELTRDMPFRHMCNLSDAFASYREIRHMLTEGVISHAIPGHDESVMTRFPPAEGPLRTHAVVVSPA
jgi:glyoxylase-like metal-dependent hydrolase (beta-lactamase superfamily II)